MQYYLQDYNNIEGIRKNGGWGGLRLPGIKCILITDYDASLAVVWQQIG